MRRLTHTLFYLIIMMAVGFVPTVVSAYTLQGVVTDADGNPLEYAVISVERVDKSCLTDAKGHYAMSLPKNKYEVKASSVGYETVLKTIDLKADASLDFVLTSSDRSLGVVSVYGKSKSRRLKEGAYAVNALDIKPIVNTMSTLDNVVDRSVGVKVRREGGLGSDYDLSINGLSGNSIRYFIDGVPLDSKGSDMKLYNVPLNTVERVEIYKGVVPVSLGSDALGGAINIITNKRRSNYIDASYGFGSFHTHTADVTGQFYIPRTKVLVRPTVSIHGSKNNYKMKGVEVWDEDAGKYILTDKRRFHDDYFSSFVQMEAGAYDVKWADEIFVNGSYSKVDKELQTGAMQNKVYGNATRHVNSWNVSARYAKRFNKLSIKLNLSHTWDKSQTVDTAYRKYSWDGTWMPSSGNEINNKAKAIRIYNRPLTVVNGGLDYEINRQHMLSFNYMLNRRGNDRHDEIDESFEPTNDVVTKHIISLSYSQSFFNDRWQTSYFVKDYINSMSVEQDDNSTITGADKVDSDATKNYWGAGVGTRYSIIDQINVKGSYEHSVRLPLSRELLGNGTTVYPNLTLAPETSNNYNLGLFGTWYVDDDNMLTYEASGFIRHVQNYIRATVSERDGMMQYVNEPAIDVKGLDLELGYVWRNSLQIMLNGSWNDARDLKRYKSDGNPSATYKNRVPNRPWIYANAEAKYTFRNVLGRDDRLVLGCAYQWIHWYYLNWEAYGAVESKARIPSQNITDVSLVYSWHGERYNLSLECNNLFDKLVYDNYMLQKPGRALYAKFRLFIN